MRRLAAFIRQRNGIDREISEIIGRPAHPGHMGEFLASRIFNIRLADSATTKGIDGHFVDGPLAGKSVNVKEYSKNDHLSDIKRDAVPGVYLVLTGPKAPATSSRGATHPWTIAEIFLFDGPALVRELQSVEVKLSEATSVRSYLWDAAEIYPKSTNPALQLSAGQLSMIEMFGEPNVQVDS